MPALIPLHLDNCLLAQLYAVKHLLVYESSSESGEVSLSCAAAAVIRQQ